VYDGEARGVLGGLRKWGLVRAFIPIWGIAVTVGAAGRFDELAASAAAARRANQIPEAIALYRQALELNGDWAEGWWFAGTLSYALFNYKDCESALGRFVTLDGSRALGFALLGLCEFENGHGDAARAHIERGLAPGGNLPPEVEAGVRFHYGMLLTQAGSFEPGRRELARFARAGDAQPVVVLALGLNALRERLLPKDLPLERQGLVKAAGHAACAWMAGDSGKADEAFAVLVSQYPASPGVHYFYGTYLGTSEPEESRVQFERELQIQPANGAADAMLALLLLPEDDAGALKHAQHAFAEMPADPLAAYAYGKALLAKGAVREAIERLEAAERMDTQTLAYHTALADAYARMGLDEDARRERAQSKSMAKEQSGTH
jgi:tetratricopeptide (TPR) repeat protein